MHLMFFKLKQNHPLINKYHPVSAITQYPVNYKRFLCRRMRAIESVAYIYKLLRSTTHNGFPVVRGNPGSSDTEYQDRNGPLQGLILRSQLLVLIEKKVTPEQLPFPSSAPSKIMQSTVISATPQKACQFFAAFTQETHSII